MDSHQGENMGTPGTDINQDPETEEALSKPEILKNTYYNNPNKT